MKTRVPRDFSIVDPAVIWREDDTHGLIPSDGDRARVGRWSRETGVIVPNAGGSGFDVFWEIDGVNLQPRGAS